MMRATSFVALLLLLGCSSQGGGDAGSSSASASERVAEDGICGGIAGLACEEGLWCDPDPGFCDGADIHGLCIVVPEMCTRDYRPVCGCDGQTYGNDCTRRSAKVAKDHDGGCDAVD